MQKGDSLSAIARSQGVPLGTLMQVNGLSINSVIHPDQTLIIPGR
ncbi:MAG: LysM peptidoglycan-binding domain-containing protein [Verrucomicrobiaceae bacterium]|nr:LysM peptidoglycan-binding domain-containing protein [Verrucomicrobiaceae bacterium]